MKDDDALCQVCGKKARVQVMGVPPDHPIIYVVRSTDCRRNHVFIDKDAYPEITRSDLPDGDRIRAGLRARLEDPDFGSYANPITLADVRELSEAA